MLVTLLNRPDRDALVLVPTRELAAQVADVLQKLGTHLPELRVAMLIGGVIALLTGISAAEVGVNYPQEGGAFIWTRRFGFRTVSFVAGIAYLFDGIVGLGVLALGFATYSAQLFPGLPVPLAAPVSGS